nr:probable transport protein, chloroplastic [Tanacetum cinerariifolium]
LILSGFGHTRRLLERLERGVDWDDCGVLQLAFDEKERERQAQLAAAFPDDLLHVLDPATAQSRAGVALESGGLFYPQGGWVHPPALCRHQVSMNRVQVLAHREVIELRRDEDQWQAWDGERLLASACVVVLAGAAEIKRFPASAELPLKRIRGQITRLAETPASQALATVVCAEGYVAPARGGEHTLGASFAFHSDDLTPSVTEHLGNIALLREISEDLSLRLNVDTLPPENLQGRAAFRCTSPDYLPIVGPLADRAAFLEAYAVLRKDARQTPDTECPWLEGLYVNSGHGSRGLITAPLSGELIAAWLDNEPLPLPRSGGVKGARRPPAIIRRNFSRQPTIHCPVRYAGTAQPLSSSHPSIRCVSMLQVQGVFKSYTTAQGPLAVLRGADLQLDQGGSLALMGESGSGKSTLLHLVAGLDQVDKGSIEVAGRRLDQMNEAQLANWRRTEIGLVFQQFNLIGSLKVEDNLAFQARLAGRHNPEWQAELTERLGLGALLKRYPEQLSGGQQQRVAIGRALASRPGLLLADEPTGNLDEATSDEVLQLLLDLLRDSTTSLLMVTHSPRVAARLQRQAVLHLGRLVREGER